MSAPTIEPSDARETRTLIEYWCECGERAVFDGIGGVWCEACLSADRLYPVTLLCEVVAHIRKGEST